MSGAFSRNFDDLIEIYDNILEGADADAERDWGADYKEFVSKVESRVSKRVGWTKSPSALLSVGARQRQHMISVLDMVRNYLESKPRGTVVDVLDADCGFGHGTDLLASQYLTSELGYRLRVAALNGDYRLLPYLKSQFHTFVCLPKRLEGLNRTYELVISLFHVQREVDPAAYCGKLQKLTTGRIILLAPYDEPSDQRVSSHRSTIDDALLSSLGAENVSVFRSPAWGTSEQHRVVRFDLAGLAV